MLWIFALLMSGVVNFSLGQKIKTGFSCAGKATGYYADIASGCKIYYMCDGLGRQFSYTCPNATLFQQRMLVCDHWYMVNCSRALDDYSANLLIGQPDRRFVEEGEPSRTPRPDLLKAANNRSEYDVIYSTTDNQNYNPVNPPSHWSTEYSKVTTEQPQKNKKPRVKAIDFNSARFDGNRWPDTSLKFKFIQQNSAVTVNYKSNFKATTPVYPLSVEDTTTSPNNVGLLPPLPYVKSQSKSPNRSEYEAVIPRKQTKNEETSTELNRRVNFQSRFKATTPVYPSREELEEQQRSKTTTEEKIIPGKSNFKATTPSYPSVVESTSPDPEEAGLLPPQQNEKFQISSNNEKVPSSNSQVPVNFKSDFKATTPVYPTAVDLTSPSSDEAGLVPPINKKNSENTKHVINFESSFKATTPVYPTSVEPTSPNPHDAGLIAPSGGKPNLTTPELNLVPPKFNENYKTDKDHNITTKIDAPSKFYQPPKFEPDFTELTSNNVDNPGVKILNFMKSFNTSQWQDLRKAFHIPEYDFPLEDPTRPSYDSIFNSFEAKQIKKR